MESFWTKENIAPKVVEIIVDRLEVAPEIVKPESKLRDDLGADSLDTIDVVMTFEREFGISIPDSQLDRIGREYTVSETCDLLLNIINK